MTRGSEVSYSTRRVVKTSKSFYNSRTPVKTKRSDMDYSKKLIFTVWIILFVCTDRVLSLKCYSCGTIDPKCRDPFDKDKEGVYSFDCSGSCYKAKSQNGDITRGCWPRPMEKKCTDQTVADRQGIDGPGTACHCSDNLCNGTSTKTGLCIITTLLLLTYSMLKHYLVRL